MVESTNATFDTLQSVKALKEHYEQVTSKIPLRELLGNEKRNALLRSTMEDIYQEGKKLRHEKYTDATFSIEEQIYFDYTHTHIDEKGIELLYKVMDETKVASKIKAMFEGETINETEKRKVWHTKLRENSQFPYGAEPSEANANVKKVNEQIK